MVWGDDDDWGQWADSVVRDGNVDWDEQEVVEIEGPFICLVDSGKAFLFSKDLENYWIPRSQMRMDEEIFVGWAGDLTITEWIAGEKGLI